MQARPMQDVARPPVSLLSAVDLKVGQWVILHMAEADYIAKVEKLRDFDGHWQVRIYVPTLGKHLWQYWNHLQPIRLSAQYAPVGSRVRFLQQNGLISIGEVTAHRETEVLVRNGSYSFAIPRFALVEVIGRLR